MGISDEKANQDIANLTAFGEEALESMSRMGIGYRELRQFRRLQDDQKSANVGAFGKSQTTLLFRFIKHLRHHKTK
ncbi:hypothetical protein AC85_0028 [Escherichia coli 3-020-07_S4_C1]|nr:hypothetical protein AD30_4046 [Escherichia coli 2-316-03_S4_C3]KEJ63225.1 hypothetical protein AC85_0028 [Escherichia coli 3-020-07_S4_C1]